MSLPRYSIDDFEMFHRARPKGASTAKLDRIPSQLPEKFLELVKHNSELREVWEGRRKPSGDQTGSGHDFLLIRLLLRNDGRLTREEIAAVVTLYEHGKFARCRREGVALPSASYLERTISKAIGNLDVPPEARSSSKLAETASSPWSKAIPAPDFVDVEDERVQWLEEPFLARGSITEVFSPRGVGKTHVALHLAVLVARRGCRVLYLDRDNSRHEVKRRLRNWGGRDVPTLKVMTRDDAPPLSRSKAWQKFPANEYDVVVIDALDSTAEGVGEQDSSRSSLAFSQVLDIAHRADGPAILVLGNTIKSGAHGRGSGIIEDRADIVFEVRDATDYRPSGTKAWFEELPSGSRSDWSDRARRRTQRDVYRLALIPSKFRIGVEPAPLCLEVSLRDDHWSITDVTAGLDSSAAEASTEASERHARKIEAALGDLEILIRDRPDSEPVLKEKDAVPFLMGQGIRRTEARRLIQTNDDVRWRLTALKGKGAPVALRPLGAPGRPAAKTEPLRNPSGATGSTSTIPADRLNQGRPNHPDSKDQEANGLCDSTFTPPSLLGDNGKVLCQKPSVDGGRLPVEVLEQARSVAHGSVRRSRRPRSRVDALIARLRDYGVDLELAHDGRCVQLVGGPGATKAVPLAVKLRLETDSAPLVVALRRARRNAALGRQTSDPRSAFVPGEAALAMEEFVRRMGEAFGSSEQHAVRHAAWGVEKGLLRRSDGLLSIVKPMARPRQEKLRNGTRRQVSRARGGRHA